MDPKWTQKDFEEALLALARIKNREKRRQPRKDDRSAV